MTTCRSSWASTCACTGFRRRARRIHRHQSRSRRPRPRRPLPPALSEASVKFSYTFRLSMGGAVIIRHSYGSGRGRVHREALTQPRAAPSLMKPPTTSALFRELPSDARDAPSRVARKSLRGSGEIVGHVNVSEIVRGFARSPARLLRARGSRGEASCGRDSAPSFAMRFTSSACIGSKRTSSRRTAHRWHSRSQRGFAKEGYSRRYLKISGRWRDHERRAIVAP